MVKIWRDLQWRRITREARLQALMRHDGKKTQINVCCSISLQFIEHSRSQIEQLDTGQLIAVRHM